MAILTTTMPLNFDSSGVRLHIISRYSSDLLVMLYLSRCQRSQLMDNRGGLEDMGFLGRNNSNTSHKSHGYWVLRVLFVVKPAPTLAIHTTIKHTGSGPKIIPRKHGLTPIIDRRWNGRIIVVALVHSNRHIFAIKRRQDTIEKA